MALNPLNSGNLEQLALKRLTASLNYLMKLKIEPFSATAIYNQPLRTRGTCARFTRHLFLRSPDVNLAEYII